MAPGGGGRLLASLPVATLLPPSASEEARRSTRLVTRSPRLGEGLAGSRGRERTSPLLITGSGGMSPVERSPVSRSLAPLRRRVPAARILTSIPCGIVIREARARVEPAAAAARLLAQLRARLIRSLTLRARKLLVRSCPPAYDKRASAAAPDTDMRGGGPGGGGGFELPP